MKKAFCLKVLSCALLLASSAALADAPADMIITNDTGYSTSAYVHNVASEPVGPHSEASIPWSAVTSLCHGDSSMVKDADPCAFEVYLSRNTKKPQQIDFATVTFYVSNGKVVDINYVKHIAKLKIESNAAGSFTLEHV